ncbi:faeA-like family protein [Serratia fonticola]
MKNQCSDGSNLERVLMALQALCDFECSLKTLPPQVQWPKTRHIADFCNMDIYTSRRYLMKLVKNHKAYMSAGLINNSLRWYIAEPVSFGTIEQRDDLDR